MWARTRVPREKQTEGRKGRMLTRAPVQPPREECEREYRPTKEMKAETKAESERVRSARDTKKKISIKEGRDNFGKQMKRRVRHLV